MNHVVMRILDGLPVYIKEENKQFVELLRVYYKWQTTPGKSLDVLYSHDGLLDIDVNGLGRSILELDEEFIPVEHRRAWKAFARHFNSSRGSIQSYVDFFRILFSAPVEIEDTSKRVFKTSAATQERYQRMIVQSSVHISGGGVLFQEATGVRADIVESVRYANSGGYHELLVKPRTGEFMFGAAVVQTASAQQPVEIRGHTAIEVTAGQAYRVGDLAVFSNGFSHTKGRVKKLHPARLSGVDIWDMGEGYAAGDVITVKGWRGFRAEVVSADSDGAIDWVRIIDYGDDFEGDIVFDIHSVKGHGGDLRPVGSFGRPKEFEWETRPFGNGILAIFSSTGSGFAYNMSRYLWHPHIVRTGFNGVISIGTVITDSYAWQDMAYRVNTPVDVELWEEKVRKILHPVGKVMTAVKTVNGSCSMNSTFTSETTVTEVTP